MNPERPQETTAAGVAVHVSDRRRCTKAVAAPEVFCGTPCGRVRGTQRRGHLDRGRDHQCRRWDSILCRCGRGGLHARSVTSSSATPGNESGQSTGSAHLVPPRTQKPETFYDQWWQHLLHHHTPRATLEFRPRLSDNRLDMAPDAQVEDAARQLFGATLASLIATYGEWVHRRKDSSKFIDATTVRRHLEIEFTPPPAFQNLPPDPPRVIPLTLLSKQGVILRAVTNESGVQL